MSTIPLRRLWGSTVRRLAGRILPAPGASPADSGRTRPLIVDLEFPYQAEQRWTTNKPHEEILRRLEAGVDTYRDYLSRFNSLSDRLSAIPANSADPLCPCWDNGWLPTLDAIALYGFVAETRPKRYFEIGSGNSTLFVRRAIQDGALSTHVTSIDPTPRRDIDAVCDRSIREPLEATDLGIFSEAEPGDIVFVDCSHRALMNSDATVFFLEVLPKLPAGILVGVHDIFWPLDYPKAWVSRAYSEQYLLAPLILWKEDFDIVLPSFFVSVWPRHDLMSTLQPLWQVLPQRIERYGGTFWFRWGKAE